MTRMVAIKGLTYNKYRHSI